MLPSSRRRGAILLVGFVAGALPVGDLHGQLTKQLDSTTISAFRWRSIGPANMSGRVTDVEGLPSPSRTFFVATAAGGIFKTINGGASFRPLFQNERCASMGDLAIAPSDSNVIYAGTGEEDSRNSISPGCGLYKSTDGGLTWKYSGLGETQQIGRMLVHPKDPNTVWVAALGHVWGPNKERGLYKTTDGGTTWRLVKFISDKAGFIDMVMDPTNPNLLFASSYERVRGPYFLKSGGPGSALWKTTDAGETWTEVTGGGFPATMKGRIGLAIAASDPKVLYALVEADTLPNPKPVKGKPAQVRPSGLYRSGDGGATWTKMASTNVRPFYYSQVRVDIKNPDRVYWSSTPVNFSTDGGKTVRQASQGIHVDHHAMWLDPADENHFIVGNDGGIGQTWDKGGNYDFINSFAIGQFYAASFDMAVPYNVCGGLQDNGSWCGPSRRKSGPITNAMWHTFNGGDGFWTAQDPTDHKIVYGESQGGNIARFQWDTGERFAFPKPNWRARAAAWDDSVLVARGDTLQPETALIKKRLADLKTARSADSANTDTRWNWNTPFFLSAHNPTVIYIGANRVMKSVNRGASMFPISPDLSLKDTMKLRVSTTTTGGITPDVTGAETYGTIVALAESALLHGTLYAGTDDGNVWITRNDGASWDNLTSRISGVPPQTYVSRIEPSPTDSATFYVTYDNHRNNDFTPYVFVTHDFGKTFRSIASNLPTGGPDFVHVIRESSVNKNLLFVGTDVGVYLSTDRGANWHKFMAGLPTTPVHDLKIHPRERELIAATHGRSIWIVDIGPLEQITDDVLAASAARPVRIDTDLFVFDLEIDVFRQLRPDVEGRKRRMAARGLVEGRNAHEAVHAGLGRQQPVRVLPCHRDRGTLDPGLFGRLKVDHFSLEPSALRPPEVHAKQHLGPVLRLGPARAGVDRDDRVLAVVLAAEHLLDLAGLHVLLERVQATRELGIDRLARIGPFEQDRQVVGLLPEREDQVAVLLQASPPLQHLLRVGLVFPEIWRRRAGFEASQLLIGFGGLKDSSASRWPVGRALRIVASGLQR